MRKKVSESFKDKLRKLHLMSMAFALVAITVVLYTFAVRSAEQLKYVIVFCMVIAVFFFICDVIYNYVIKFLEEGISKGLIINIIREILVLLIIIHLI
ncbi:hypothetical protein CFOLD11_12180 [Clostridium folliculivorans]|uniref:Uncharacterized protein n=1 Tax=Clostridium folliculivorans TaxID=2886038 RepID=A0A9W6DA27_9CLOT|nr:hypothetical protein [Clostridium folliculivorans]GKU24392.1 hypothetical protein CFOLD11_12180 [Clostridium folliculivorans]